MLAILIAAAPVLVSVTVWAALVVKRFCEAKVMLNGEIEAAGPPVVPVPARLIDCGLPVTLSAIETVAVRVPEAVGEKTTLMLQLPPAATETPQVLVWEKSPGFAPVIVMLEMDNRALPVLNRLTPLAGLLLPTA